MLDEDTKAKNKLPNEYLQIVGDPGFRTDEKRQNLYKSYRGEGYLKSTGRRRPELSRHIEKVVVIVTGKGNYSNLTS